MSRVVPGAFAAVLAVVALSACGTVEQAGRGSPTNPSAPASPRTSATRSTTPGTPPIPTSPLPTTASGPLKGSGLPPSGTGGKLSAVRVKGTVSDGIEPGCRLLTSKGVVYLLVLPQGTAVNGREVEVQGTLQPDLTTTCQQGTPLVVARILSP